MTASNNRAGAQSISTIHSLERANLIVVAGPTAVGKTALSIALAQQFAGEVVNADSRYLYQGFDIGVDKPAVEDRAGIPHHLIDILPPTGDMSLARYQDLAMASIREVTERGKLPILTGGTPLYINAVVEGWRIPRVPPNPAFRAACEAEMAADGGARLRERLRRVDPVSAERCGANMRRVIRALEVFEGSGIPMSEQESKGPPPFRALELGLTRPRANLHAAIDQRVTAQLARGLVTEVRTLLADGVPSDAPAMSSIGYRQLLPYLAGQEPLEVAVARIQHDTHRYVRHQETWLRRNPRIVPIDSTVASWKEDAIQLVAAFLDHRASNDPSYTD